VCFEIVAHGDICTICIFHNLEFAVSIFWVLLTVGFEIELLISMEML
jgi:hypothetical protein